MLLYGQLRQLQWKTYKSKTMQTQAGMIMPQKCLCTAKLYLQLYQHKQVLTAATSIKMHKKHPQWDKKS